MGRIVNKRELSEILGTSERSLTEWQKQGLPVLLNAGRGAENQYDTAQVIAWVIARELSRVQAESPKDRLDRIRGDREELALAKDLGEVAPAVMFEQTWADHILAARTELLALPDILASELHALYGVDVDGDLIKARVEGALAKLESYDVADDDPEFAAPDEGDEGDDS
jgi:phage terminase Nu1 subunit (DNA packaging protein)